MVYPKQGTKRFQIWLMLDRGYDRDVIARAVGTTIASVKTEVARKNGYISPSTLKKRAEREEIRLERIELARRTPNLIPLTRCFFAKIDEEDFDELIASMWNTHGESRGRLYAYRSDNKKMHRIIMRAEIKQLVDHKNGDGLDNRKCNLRIATDRQNAWNTRLKGGTSGYIGVWKNGPGWSSVITGLDGNRKFLGQFRTPEEAALAYDIEAAAMRGEFAITNTERRRK